MLPDVIRSDHVVDACRRIGCQFTESLFFRACLEIGYGQGSEQKARELQQIWARSGYNVLPLPVKKFILRVLNGEVSPAI